MSLAEVLAELQLPSDTFDDPENVLPFPVVGQLLDRCRQRTGLADVGLRIGHLAGASSLGAVGYLAQSSADVRSALLAIRDFLHLYDRGADVIFRIEDGFAELGYAIHDTGMAGGDLILDVAIAIGLNTMRFLCGPDWVPTQVLLSHAAPANPALYRTVFGVTPQFNAPRSVLVFPVHWLERRVAGADPLLHRMMAERIRELRKDEAETFAGRVLRLLRQAEARAGVTQQDVASRLDVHVRMMNRRLADEGTSFLRLREEVRFEMARHLLGNTRMKASEVAVSLGYAAAGAFTRAFKRWSGVTPAQWRAGRRKEASRRRRLRG